MRGLEGLSARPHSLLGSGGRASGVAGPERVRMSGGLVPASRKTLEQLGLGPEQGHAPAAAGNAGPAIRPAVCWLLLFFPRPEWEPPSHHTEVMTWKQLGSWINWASGLASPSDHSRDPRPDRRPRPCSPDPGARSCPQPDPRARPVPPNSRFSKAIFLNLHLSQVGSETQRPWGNGGQAPLAGPPRTLQSLGVVYPP